MSIYPLVAHRGFPSRYPENTVSGLQEAVKAGAGFVEFDVQLSADRIPVLMHDADLERTTGFKGCVMDVSSRELTYLRADEKKRFKEKFSHEPVPTLSAVVNMLKKKTGVTAFVEIKKSSILKFGVDETVERILEVLEPVSGQYVIISFHAGCLIKSRSLGSCRIGWVFENWSSTAIEKARTLAPDFVFTDYTCIPSSVENLSEYPWKWVLYEISDPDKALLWLSKGAELIETNSILEMGNYMQEHKEIFGRFYV